MSRAQLNEILTIAVILVIASACAWAGSQGGVVAGGVPVFVLVAGVAFSINWLVFVPSFLGRSERFFDLTGTLTYLSVLGVALSLRPSLGFRDLLLAALISVWAIRLGGFLFRRIREDGSDGRFDSLKTDFLVFLRVWTLQGLWVFLTAACGLAALTVKENSAMGWVGWLGVCLWLLGFGIEVVADQQKRAFRAVPENRDRFITRGLWAWSRHPNYFGEIMLWVGIAMIALPTLEGWRYATLISPLFVFVLLSRISGVPLLERRGAKEWGDDPAYRAYKERTPVLFPRPPAAT